MNKLKKSHTHTHTHTLLNDTHTHTNGHISTNTHTHTHTLARIDCVEIMACPSGCVNGGGQVKGEEGEGRKEKERVKRVKDRFMADFYTDTDTDTDTQGETDMHTDTHTDTDTDTHTHTQNEKLSMCEWVYTHITPQGPLSKEAQALFHTHYHTVPKLELANPSVIKW